MIDIDKAEKKISALDKFLTSLKLLLKKHWGLILLLLLCGFIYWAFTLPPVDEHPYEREYIEEVEPGQYLSPGAIPADEYYEEDDQYDNSYYEDEDY